MKEKLGIREKAASASGVTMHAFSMGQSLDTHFMDSSGEIGKLKAEIGELKYKMQESTVTPKNNEQKYKPVITPPRRRESSFCGGGSFGNRSQGAQNVRDNQRIVRILSCQTLFYRQISMAMPKANNDHFPRKT